MKLAKIFFAAALAATLFSCTKDNSGISGKTSFTVDLLSEIPSDPKPALDTDGSTVIFNAGDMVSVFDGTDNNLFTTAEGGVQARFSGTAAQDAPRYVIVSPYDPDLTVNGSVVTYQIPEVQTATPGTADPKALVSAGTALKLGSGSVQLYNAVSLVKVIVPEGLAVKEIQVGGGKGCNIAIAGTYTFNAQDHNIGLVDGRTSITMIPQEGRTTIAPGTYYIVVRPKSKYDNGLALAYVNEHGRLCKRTTSNAVDIVRGHILPLGTLNVNDFAENTGTAVLRTSGDEVQFTGRLKKLAGGSGTATEVNDNIEHIVIQAHSLWDGNFNNNANVVSSGKGNTNIFAYVKGNTVYVRTEASVIRLQSASNYLFRDFRALKSVTFNNVHTESSTSFERMFSGCTSLESVDFGDCDFSDVRDMQFMFQGLSSLRSVRFGKTSSASVTNFKGMFMECTNVTELDFGPDFTVTHLADKSMCNNMFYNTARDSNAAAGADPTKKCRLCMSQAEYDELRQDQGGSCSNSALNPARFYFVPLVAE